MCVNKLGYNEQANGYCLCDETLESDLDCSKGKQCTNTICSIYLSLILTRVRGKGEHMIRGS